jgi:hypothetical protein
MIGADCWFSVTQTQTQTHPIVRSHFGFDLQTVGLTASNLLVHISRLAPQCRAQMASRQLTAADLSLRAAINATEAAGEITVAAQMATVAAAAATNAAKEATRAAESATRCAAWSSQSAARTLEVAQLQFDISDPTASHEGSSGYQGSHGSGSSDGGGRLPPNRAVTGASSSSIWPGLW